MKRPKFPSVFLPLLMTLAGAALMLYPGFSDYWNALHASRAVQGYGETVSSLEDLDREALLREAERYNRRLRLRSGLEEEDEELEREYYETLNVGENGLMCYVTVPKIRVELPVYHGTGENVLSAAAGHLEYSSLPVGGGGTHAVISAHSGAPGARLFTDLDQLEEGDRFQITVLDRVLTYQVDRVLVVEPRELAAYIAPDEGDYCTLMTCTPYGINTHRLLVRGRRVEETPEAEGRTGAEAAGGAEAGTAEDGNGSEGTETESPYLLESRRRLFLGLKAVLSILLLLSAAAVLRLVGGKRRGERNEA